MTPDGESPREKREGSSCPACDAAVLPTAGCESCGYRSPNPFSDRERAEMGEVYREQREQLLRYARVRAYRCGLPDPRRDAEDAVQAAFAAAIDQWATLENPAAWLRTVTYRLIGRAADEARSRGSVLDDVDLQAHAADGRWTSIPRRPSPDDVLMAGQVVDRIRQLGSDQQRISTYLRHVQQWSPEEIAELLELEPGTVWTHTHRGVQQIRTDFGVVPGSVHYRRSSGSAPYRRSYSHRHSGRTLLIGAAMLLLTLIGMARTIGWSWTAIGWWVAGLAGLVGLIWLVVFVSVTIDDLRRRRR